MGDVTPSIYVPLDVNYMRDPRIRRAGIAAELLYIRSLAYAKGGETDGIVHDFDIELLTVGIRKPGAAIAALVREKAWEEREGGWFICGWFNWNKSVLALREDKRRKAIGAAKTNHRKHREKDVTYVAGCRVCMGEVEE